MTTTALLILVFSMFRSATPLMLAATGGVFSERVGVINIALEGIMLTGAFAAVYVSHFTRMPLLAVVAAMAAGALLAGVHAVASIKYKANQVVSGVAINLFAFGFTEFMLSKTFQRSGLSPDVPKIENFSFLPQVSPFIPLAILVVLASQYVIFHTPWGLRLRAVGEHPLAADTVGVNVTWVRYQGVLLSGVFAGLAGASLSIGLLSRFVEGMSAGKGFIALAAMIFGKWSPLGALWACLLFGLADAVQFLLQALGIKIAHQFLVMLPYVLTMAALAGVIGRATPPASIGIPYEKEHK
jgi:general nucleoside transport system permease protein